MADSFQIITGQRNVTYTIPEHEVLISFDNDDDALAFTEWFYQNRESFDRFAKDYEPF